MAPSKKKKAKSVTAQKIEERKKLNPLRAGMPALDSIVEVEETKKGKKGYRLIRTTEIDEYESRDPKNKRKK
jgi:hypothetical protein